MADAYFESEEYINYLCKHCNPKHDESVNRVPGISFAKQFIEHLQIKGNECVLEIGCGIGRILNFIAKEYSANVLGCDISNNAIKKAKELLPLYSENFFISSSYEINLKSESVDVVIMWGVFEMTDQRLTMIELSRLLKINGRALLCSVKNKNYNKKDEESRQAQKAYIQKKFPVNYTDISGFESMINYLGFKIEKKFVFSFKDDLTKEKYIICSEEDYIQCNSDIYYIIKKENKVPIDNKIQFKPEEI